MKTITEEIERINYNENVKGILAMIFAIIVFVVIGGVIVSAIDITAGEPYFLEVKEVYDHWKVTENLSYVNVTANETGVIIIPYKYSKEDTFTITFYNQKDEVIVSHDNGQGGSGGGYYKKKIIVNETENETEEIEEVNETIDKPEEIIPIPESDDNWKIALWVIIITIAVGAILYLKFGRKNNEPNS